MHQPDYGDRQCTQRRFTLKIHAQEGALNGDAWELLLRVLDLLMRFFDAASANDEVILISSD